MDLSIIAPMYNEEENVAETVRRVGEALAGFAGTWELVIVDDGSTDGSRAKAEAIAAANPRVRVAGYTPNAGRGRALRTGFAAARGEIVASVDFDLSYEPTHILRMYEALAAAAGPDIVLVSAYMPGGTSEGVPWKRLAASKLGNRLLRLAWPKRIYTSTCIVRGYRRRALEQLAPKSDGKEIHLEILSQAFAKGLRIEEIPGHLRKDAGEVEGPAGPGDTNPRGVPGAAAAGLVAGAALAALALAALILVFIMR